MRGKLRARPAHKHRRTSGRHRLPRLSDDDPERQPPTVDAALAREAELERQADDDFADGRSSARALRGGDDSWGRGLAPEERPFEEEDVPARALRAPRSEPAPDPEEPDVEAGG